MASRQGVRWLPAPRGCPADGVIVSPDGKDIYLALWSGKQVARIDRSTTPPKVDTVPTGILTDNVRWGPGGKSIFVGGQDVTVKQAIDCFEVQCRQL